MALAQSVASELLEAFRAGEGVDLARVVCRHLIADQQPVAELITAPNSAPP